MPRFSAVLSPVVIETPEMSARAVIAKFIPQDSDGGLRIPDEASGIKTV